MTPNMTAAEAKHPITEEEVYINNIKLKLMPLIAAYRMNNNNITGDESLVQPNAIRSTKPSGANMVTLPRVVRPVSLTIRDNKLASLANRKAKKVDMPRAANIQRKTLAKNVLETVPVLIALPSTV